MKGAEALARSIGRPACSASNTTCNLQKKQNDLLQRGKGDLFAFLLFVRSAAFATEQI